MIKTKMIKRVDIDKLAGGKVISLQGLNEDGLFLTVDVCEKKAEPKIAPKKKAVSKKKAVPKKKAAPKKRSLFGRR